MRAIVLNQPGGTESLQYKEIPQPEIKANEVLVKVKSIGLNPVDIKTRKGLGVYGRIKDDVPLIIGWDISGEVLKTGNAVTKFKQGDEVFGMVNFPGHGKAYSEFVAAPQEHLALKPTEITHDEAAAASLALLTAYQVLVQEAKIKSRERVLIHAAAGGVGHFAVQLAKEWGTYVLGTSSGKHKDFLKESGLDEHIDYTKTNFEQTVKEVDVVLDPIGGEHLLKSLQVLKKGGRLISIVGMSDEIKQKAEEAGVIAFPYLVHSSGEDMEKLAGLLKTGTIKPYISHTYDFDSIVEAHQELETGRTRGKIVLKL